MPFDGLNELDTEQRGRILKMAMAAFNNVKNKSQIEQHDILNEVIRDYKRTANQIVMEETMKTEDEREVVRKHDNYGRGYVKINEDEMIPANLTMPPKPKEKPVPYFAQVPIPKHDFPEQFSTFCFHSLFIKDEVITAMVKIRQQCNEIVEEAHIFDASLRTVMRVEEFKQRQNSSITALKSRTGEIGWCNDLCKTIKTSFKAVGKGWFNLNVTEDEKESYEFGKLKKFLQLVNFMMQDTVLNLCKNSVEEFVAYMLDYIPDQTEIISASDVKNRFKRLENVQTDEDEENTDLVINEDDPEGVKETKKWVNSQFAKNKNPEPLFLLDLILKKSLVPTFNNSPTEIVKRITEVFEAGIESLQAIPHLEPLLLRQLFKTHGLKTIKTPVIPHEKPKAPDPNDKKALIDENTWLWEAFDELKVNLTRAIQPLDEYVKTYSAFEEQYKLDPDQYVNSLDEDPENPDKQITPQELQYDIYKQKEKQKELLDRIPEQITVSMFAINCKDIRNFYSQKYEQIVDKEIKLIASKTKEKTLELSTTFMMMEEKILKVPKTIDELTDIKDYINEGGNEIEKMKQQINESMEFYGILDEFNYEFTSADHNNKWELYGAPQRVARVMQS
jgi:dynein heavy chain, axonemal